MHMKILDSLSIGVLEVFRLKAFEILQYLLPKLFRRVILVFRPVFVHTGCYVSVYMKGSQMGLICGVAWHILPLFVDSVPEVVGDGWKRHGIVCMQGVCK